MNLAMRSGGPAEHDLVIGSYMRHQATAAGMRLPHIEDGARRLMTRLLAKPGLGVRLAVDADDNGKVLGLAVLDEPAATLWWVWVRHESQGWGICRALLQDAPSTLRAPWLGRRAWMVARCVGRLVYDPLALLEV